MNVKIRNKFIEIKYFVPYGLVRVCDQDCIFLELRIMEGVIYLSV